MATVKWDGDRFQRLVMAGMQRRMGRAVAFLQKKIIRSLGVGAGKRGQLGASAPGQPPRYRTGFLKQSIHTAVTPDGPLGVRGTVGAYGPAYARALELGMVGVVTVSAHMRRSKIRKVSAKTGKRLKGKIFGAAHQVRTHSMRMNLKPRPYLSRALADNLVSIRAQLTAPGLV